MMAAAWPSSHRVVTWSAITSGWSSIACKNPRLVGTPAMRNSAAARLVRPTAAA